MLGKWATRRRRKRLPTVLATLGTGFVGGVFFHWVGLPMPWLLGAIIGSAASAMLGVPAGVPRWLRDAVLVVLGLMIGATIHQNTLELVTRWPVTMAAVAVYVAVSTAGMYIALRRICGFDPVTAYFSAAPGGFIAMTVIGGSFGGRERSIALTHAVRIVLVIFTVVLSYHMLLGVSALPPRLSESSSVTTPLQWLGLLAIGLVGWLLGRLVRLPSSAMLGPLLLMGAMQLAGFQSSPMPRLPLQVAEVVLGSGIGADFAGATLRELGQSIAISLVATASMLALSLAFSFALQPLTGIPIKTLFLALSPGGLSGISLVALALGIEPAFVTAHNVLRILLILLAGPLVFRLLKRPSAEN